MRFVYVRYECLDGNDVMPCVLLFTESTYWAIKFTSFSQTNKVE